MIDTIIAAGILAGFFASLDAALHYAAKAKELQRRLVIARRLCTRLRADIYSLKAALEKAQRNDTPKDPVTGRFTAKEKP